MPKLNSTPKLNCNLYLAVESIANLKSFPDVTDKLADSSLAQMLVREELKAILSASEDSDTQIGMLLDLMGRCIHAGSRMVKPKRVQHEKLIQL